MKTKTLLFTALGLALILNACSPFIITSSSGQQPTPAVKSDFVYTGYQLVVIDHVEVEIGVGSPIPVHVNLSGSLPDTCAQVESTDIKQDGTNFVITLSTIGSTAQNCVRDALPFTTSIPLNVLDLPAGSYSVEVNGSRADFKLDFGVSTSSLRTPDMSFVRVDVQVDDVNIEVGMGSPLPVHAIVSGNLPNACSQLGEVRIHRYETTFFAQLVAHLPAETDCNPDTLPFRLEIPLNIVNLPDGPYEVNVNGVTASFDPRTMPAHNPDQAACTAFVDVPNVNGKVSYNGISFNVDPSLADTLNARICPATTGQEPQMVHEAHPPYTQFLFPTYRRENTDFQPEVRVYEVTGDLESYLFPLNVLGDLKTVIEQRPEPAAWFAHSPLHVRQEYLSFTNGAGVRGLIQYMQDRFFYTNNGLTYEFNGLTQDERYFVRVRFPVSVPFLMELDNPVLPPANLNPQAISIPEWPGDFEQQLKIIETYNAEALDRFDQMAESDASPNLTSLDELVQSILVIRP